MTNKELSVVLRELACSQPTPLCKQWTDEWEDDSSIDELLGKYVRGFDFCVKNDYPPLDFIRRNFNTEDLHRHNIYIDEEVSIDDADSGIYVFLGTCTGKITFNGFKAATVYLRHESNVSVTALNGARCFVTCYEKSDCELSDDRYSVVKKYVK